MKRLLPFLLLAASLTATAQTLRVSRNRVHHVFAATPDVMTFAADASSYTVTIGGVTYNTQEIDSIVIGTENVADSSVYVTYNTDGTADVVISGDLAPYMTTTLSGQDVSLLADSIFQKKISYYLSGTATDGSFYMDGEYSTNLYLNGVNITSSDTAAINIRNGKHCHIYISGTNNFADGAGGGQKGAFFCNGHATIHGNGTVNITGNARHGYRSDEYTVFDEDFTGHFNVLAAVNDGLNVQQYLRIANGTINVQGNIDDAIDVGINKDSTKLYNGQMFVSGGTITASAISADTRAIVSDSTMTITGGTFNISVPGDGCKGIYAGWDFKTNGGVFNITMTGGAYNTVTATGQQDVGHCQGIRVWNDFYLAGDADNHPTFSITNQSSDEKAVSIRIKKGYLYYVAAALTGSGFPTKDVKYPQNQVVKMDKITF